MSTLCSIAKQLLRVSLVTILFWIILPFDANLHVDKIDDNYKCKNELIDLQLLTSLWSQFSWSNGDNSKFWYRWTAEYPLLTKRTFQFIVLLQRPISLRVRILHDCKHENKKLISTCF